MSLAVVGGIHPNKDGSNRLFEIAMCLPGEPVQLVCEPRNRHDTSAVAVFSERGIQLGYLSADRCGWIGGKIAQGEDIQAVFQQAVCRLLNGRYGVRDCKVPENDRKLAIQVIEADK